MRLHELRAPRGANRPPFRKGRGIASGGGKTAGRGQKGQKARAGEGIRPGFEGGQMPLHRRIPKRGFRNIFKKEWAVVNVRELNRFPDGTVVTPELLKEEGLIKRIGDGVKVLGTGELERALTVRAHKFSAEAARKIAAAGGKPEVI